MRYSGAMPFFVRTVLLWLVMLALPMQGLAAAVRVHCASHAAGVQVVADDEHATHDDEAHGHHHAAATDGDGDAAVSQGGSCSACAACCSALGLPAAWPPFAAAPPADLIGATPTPQPTSFVPAGLERPPRRILA